MKKKIFLLSVFCLIGWADLFAPRSRSLWISPEQYQWYCGWATWYRSIGLDPHKDVDWSEARYLLASPGQTAEKSDPFEQFGPIYSGRRSVRKRRLPTKRTEPPKVRRVVVRVKRKKFRNKRVAESRSGERIPCSHPGCKSIFHSRRKDQIRDHKNMHTGQRPYKCLACGQTFALKGSKMRHIRNRVCGAPKK